MINLASVLIDIPLQYRCAPALEKPSRHLGHRSELMKANQCPITRTALTVDTRTATEYGVVRTFAQGDFQFTTQGNSTTNPTLFSGSPSTGTSTGLLNNVGEGYVSVEYVFLQFAGFTFGKSSLAYATPWNGYPGNNSSFLLGGEDSVTGVNNIQYTAQFGNGVSRSIGLDDPTVFNPTAVYNLSTGIGALRTSGNAYARGRCVPSGDLRRYRQPQADDGLRFPRCVQPQLGSLLVDQRVGHRVCRTI